MTFRRINATKYNTRTIFSRTINFAPARPAHENNFAVRADNFDIRGRKLSSVSDFVAVDGGANFFVENSSAYGFKID